MKALNPLISDICNLFSIHPARLKTLSAIIYGIMDGFLWKCNIKSELIVLRISSKHIMDRRNNLDLLIKGPEEDYGYRSENP